LINEKRSGKIRLERFQSANNSLEGWWVGYQDQGSGFKGQNRTTAVWRVQITKSGRVHRHTFSTREKQVLLHFQHTTQDYEKYKETSIVSCIALNIHNSLSFFRFLTFLFQ